MHKICFAFAKLGQSIKQKKARYITVMVILFLLFGIGGFVHVGLTAEGIAQDIGNIFAQILAWALYGVAYLIGWLTMWVFALVITMTQFQGFIDNPGVITGWTVIRDICNMFFVVILLVIAFATILRVEKYSVKSLLPKVIFAAVAINFSKMICGLIIDFGQVVMFTFVNGFKASAGANLINGLRMQSWMSIDVDKADGEKDYWDLALAIAYACVLFFFTLVVSLIMVIMITMRIVILWILIILSPFAFVGTLLPFTQSLAQQWWKKFGTWVAIGPILAFFLWLSLLMMQGEKISTDLDTLGKTADEKSQVTGKKLQEGAMSAGATMPNAAQFAVGVALLYGAVTLTKQMGGAVGGAVAGKVMGAAAGAAFSVTGARAVTGRVKAARDIIKSKREARIREGGERLARGYERVAAPVKAGLAQAAKTPFRVAAAPLMLPRIIKGTAERWRGAREKGDGGLKTFAKSILAGVPAEVLGTRQIGSAFRQPIARAKGASNEAAKGKVADELKALKNANYDPEKSVNAMGKAATNEEAAAHLIHALKAGKITEQNMPAAQRVMERAEGTGIDSLLKEELNKKFAHSLNDMDSFEGRQKLMATHDKGDTDMTNLDASAYKDGHMAQAMMEKYGTNADKMFKKVFDRGGKYADNLIQGMKAAEGLKPEAAERLAELRGQDPETLTDMDRKEMESLEQFETADFRKYQAKATGKMTEAYTDPSDSDESAAALGKYVSELKGTKDLQKIRVDDNNQLKDGTDKQKMAIAENVSTAQLGALMRNGFDGVVKAIINGKMDVVRGGGAAGDKATLEIATVLQNNAIRTELDQGMLDEIDRITA